MKAPDPYDTPLGRCEWCGEGVWPDHARYAVRGFLWHQECCERLQTVLSEAVLIKGDQ